MSNTLRSDEIATFRQTLQTFEAAFLDWAELKGIDYPQGYTFDSIDDDSITFSYIEWIDERDHFRINEEEETIPLAFLSGDRDRIAAEITAAREAEEQRVAAEKAASDEQLQRVREEGDRAQLAKLLALYPDTAPNASMERSSR
jgi:hypothetical protein